MLNQLDQVYYWLLRSILFTDMKKKSNYIDLKPGGMYRLGAKVITFTNWLIWKATVNLRIPMSTTKELEYHR
jgi:hypothetical protein